MIKFLKNWQGLWAAIIALILFCLAPIAIQSIWPTDVGVMPGSYLQLVVLWQAIFFTGVAFSWLAYQFDFRETDQKLDDGDFKLWFDELKNPLALILVAFGPWLVLLAWQAVSLFAAIRVLS